MIAGTSAGGINGIFLAKVLAHNLSLGELRDVWLEKADIKRDGGAPHRSRTGSPGHPQPGRGEEYWSKSSSENDGGLPVLG